MISLFSSVIDRCFSYNDRQHWTLVVVKVEKRNRKKEQNGHYGMYKWLSIDENKTNETLFYNK